MSNTVQMGKSCSFVESQLAGPSPCVPSKLPSDKGLFSPQEPRQKTQCDLCLLPIDLVEVTEYYISLQAPGVGWEIWRGQGPRSCPSSDQMVGWEGCSFVNPILPLKTILKHTWLSGFPSRPSLGLRYGRQHRGYNCISLLPIHHTSLLLPGTATALVQNRRKE